MHIDTTYAKHKLSRKWILTSCQPCRLRYDNQSDMEKKKKKTYFKTLLTYKSQINKISHKSNQQNQSKHKYETNMKHQTHTFKTLVLLIQPLLKKHIMLGHAGTGDPFI